MRVAPEIQSWGEGPTSRESPAVYSKGRECPGSEKTALNKQREEFMDLWINLGMDYGIWINLWIYGLI